MVNAVLRVGVMLTAISLLVFVGIFEEASAATDPYTYLQQFGSSGSGNDQFSNPRGLAFDSSENLYVADMSNNRIQKFDSSNTFVLKWGSSGSATSSFTNPSDVAVDSSGNVYVADPGNKRIQKFDSSGS